MSVLPPSSFAPFATKRQLAALYRIASELFLYPEDRQDETVIAGLLDLSDAPSALSEPVSAFIAEPRGRDLDEYLTILELSPPCPLYLGSYLFDEPKSCLGAGLSSRNGYMLEVAATYRHFGLEIGPKELADFLPTMVEFLAISLHLPERDSIGLRRRFIERCFRPGLKPMREALAKYGSPYGLLVTALETAVEADTVLHAADPVWSPPTRKGRPPTPPVFTYSGRQSGDSSGE